MWWVWGYAGMLLFYMCWMQGGGEGRPQPTLHQMEGSESPENTNIYGTTQIYS